MYFRSTKVDTSSAEKDKVALHLVQIQSFFSAKLTISTIGNTLNQKISE